MQIYYPVGALKCGRRTRFPQLNLRAAVQTAHRAGTVVRRASCPAQPNTGKVSLDPLPSVHRSLVTQSCQSDA